MLFSDEEEEVVVANKETKTTKPAKPADKRTGNRAPKREFDRHSGTGRGREIPKNGAGARNWGNPKDVKGQLEAEVGEIPKTPEAEEVAQEPRPNVFTLEEYEAQQKAKMSSLITKKEARAVEAPTGTKLEKVAEDYFVGEGVKKTRKHKAVEEEEEEEIILNFQAVEHPHNFIPRERRSDDRRERRGGDHRERRGGDRRRQDKAPKINLKSEKAFPKL